MQIPEDVPRRPRGSRSSNIQNPPSISAISNVVGVENLSATASTALIFLRPSYHCVDKTRTIRSKNPGDAHHEIPILRSQHIFSPASFDSP
jgi:hypothetical protein